ADVISGLLALLDNLREILHSIEGTGHEGNGDDATMILRLNVLQSVSREDDHTDIANSPAEDAIQPQKPLPAKKRTRKSKGTAITQLNSGVAKSQDETNAIEVYQAEPQTVQMRSVANTSESTLRVDVDLLNRMMNLVGELVLTRNQI